MSTTSLTSGNSDVTTGTNNNFCSSASSFESVSAFDKCPRCKLNFDLHKRVNVSKVPLILNCKHTICEDCIKTMCLTNATICPICKDKFTVLRSQLDSLTDLFQPHYSLIGQLVWTKNSVCKKDLNFVSTGETLGSRYKGGGDFSEMNFQLDEKDEFDSDEGASELNLVFDKCVEHTEHYLNILCENCESTYCCYCFVENHVGHKAIYLYKLDHEENAQLQKLKNDAEVVQAQLLVSRKKTRDLKTFDLSNVECDIRKYFCDLHAKLHVAERNIRRQLLDLQSEEIELNSVNSMLKSSLQRVNHMLEYFRLLDTKTVNMKAFYEELQEIKSIPCCLVSDQGSLQPIELVYDPVLDNIEESIHLKTLPSAQYTLQPISDWELAQENYELDIIRKQNNPAVEAELRAAAAAVVVKTRKTETESKKTNEGKIRVVVTHINNLNSFYVQKYSSLDNLKDMNYMIGKRAKRRMGIENFKIGGIYGVCYETKNSNHWRRGKLLDIIDRGLNEIRYKMYFLDYGNTQVVTRERLKELDLRTVKRPPFAFECKLTNPNDRNFDSNAHMLLLQIIGEKDLYIKYIKKHAGVQEVDLLLTTSNDGFISVRELLSQTTISTPPKNDAGLSLELKLFQNSKTFTIGQEEQVIVTEIVDPFHIYVALAHNSKIIEKMKNEMEKYYPTEPSITCIPVENTDVVVNHKDDKQGNWHRAKITSVNIARKEADVYLVDWGLATTVPWAALKKLTENFIKVECQAIVVKLADVEKLDSRETWTPNAINFLREQITLEAQCRIVVSRENPLEIALFQSRPAADICINSLLVEHNHAVSIGNISQTIYWPNLINDVIVPDEEEEEEDMTCKMIKKSEEALMDDDEDVHLESGVKVPITILNIESPDLIYIKFNKDKEKEDMLHKELQIHYSTGHKNKIKSKWKEGEMCVVYDSVRNGYYRAVIRKQTSPENYVVYLFDHCRELKVSKNCIHVFDRYFKYVRCLSFKCRLAMIKPAGGVNTWTSLGIELLQKIFMKYKSIYIIEMEKNLQHKVMSVMMWYCLTTPAKALEPSKQKFISVNKTLVECGVALNAPLELNNISSTVRSVSCEKKTERTIDDEKEKDEKKIDWYDMICEDEELLTRQNSWPPPFKIQNRDFNATLTCIDTDGYFSVRDEETQALYLELEEKLTSKLGEMEIQPDLEWTVNDMCTVLFEKRWYRGTVLDILNDDEVSIEMIDFGSDHVVPKANLSKYIMFPEFPPLVNKIQLYDVHSKYGTWTQDDVNVLLEIVTDNVRVVIQGDLEVNLPFAEVYLKNGLSVNDLITTECPHMIRRENKIVLGVVDFDEERDSDIQVSQQMVNDYTYMPLPELSNGLCKMFVVNVLKWDTSYNVVLSNNANTNCDDVAALSEEIESTISEQRVLQEADLDVNKPCVCYHPEKKLWGRAKMHNVDSKKYGYILVFFVDYGTIEIISISNVKEMRCEWFALPVWMHIAFINIELLQNSQAEYVFMKLNQLRRKFISVKVISDESSLKVHLYEGDTLYYQNFIDCGIIKTSD